MPLVLQGLMCKPEFLKQSTSKKKNKCSFSYDNGQSTEIKSSSWGASVRSDLFWQRKYMGRLS